MSNMNIRKIALASAFFAVAGVAAAQSPSANLTGEAKAGDVAKVENVNTGFVREVTVKDNGRFTIRSLPTGTYKVTIRHADGSTDEPKTVTLRVGSTSRVQ
jgi:hypothetical protein